MLGKDSGGDSSSNSVESGRNADGRSHPEELQKLIDKLKDGNYYIENPSKATMRCDDLVLLTLYEPTGEKDEGKSAVMEMDIEDARELAEHITSATRGDSEQ